MGGGGGTECSISPQSLGSHGKLCHDRLPEETEGRQVGDSLEVHLEIVLCSPVHGRSLGVLPRLRLSVAQASAYTAYLNICGVFTALWQSSSPTLPEILVSGSLLPMGPAVQTWGPC